MRIFIWHHHATYYAHLCALGYKFITPEPATSGKNRWPVPSKLLSQHAIRLTRPGELSIRDIDVAIVQSIDELRSLPAWLIGWEVGCKPLIFLEHELPEGPVEVMRHPAADEQVVYVFGSSIHEVMWDLGGRPSHVIALGMEDLGYRWSPPDDYRVVSVVNQANQRGRIAGLDLMLELRRSHDLSVMGGGSEALGGPGWLESRETVWARVSQHSAYFHPFRWTTFGYSLLEAMVMGLPSVALATAPILEAFGSDELVLCSTTLNMRSAFDALAADPVLARRTGLKGRECVRERFGMDKFLTRWQELLGSMGES